MRGAGGIAIRSSEASVAVAASPDPFGAFCPHGQVRVAGAPDGPLAGLTFAVKDLFDVQGVTACFGNPTWLAPHGPATRTAPAVASLIDAGATLVGVTLTDELALSLTGENAHYGTPINARCPDRVPGGSSSGSAAAVAAGLADFALGTDTGGSVRVPASHCGLYGVRPTHGAVPCDGVWPLAPRFDTVGWMARDAATLARAGQVLLAAGAPPGDERPARARRVLISTAALSFLDADARSAFSRAAFALAAAARRPLATVALDVSGAPAASWLETYLALQNAEAVALHGSWIARQRPGFGSLIAGRFAGALAMDTRAVTRAELVRGLLDAAVTEALGDDAWLIWPSATGAAPLRGLPDDEVNALTGRALALGALASLAGLPQVSLPLGQVGGCPFGVSLIGPRGADQFLLEAAVAVAASSDVDDNTPRPKEPS